MSRSYKRTPYCGDNKGKEKKRTANKAVRTYLKRNEEEIISRKNYKKLYESWDICDYCWILTWEQYWKNAQEHRCRMVEVYGFDMPELDEKEEYRYWVKTYKNK